MEAILDFSKDLDISLFDRVVVSFYKGNDAQRAFAQQVLTQFQENLNAWQKVPRILENSTFPQSKYLGLQILQKVIQTRWKGLPEDQRKGIRNFIVNFITKIAADEAQFRKEKVLMNKLDLTLVQLLKQEWPQNWASFIPELIQASKTSLSLCENNMVILRLLSEEVFDYSVDQMTQSKATKLKGHLEEQFGEIFQLCLEVLEKAVKVPVLKTTLETLLRFLNWIPLKFIFDTSFIDMLLTRFLEAPEFRNITLKCLSEIAALNIDPEYDPKFVILFAMVMTSVNRMIPATTDIAVAYESAESSGRELVLDLTLFLSNFLSYHLHAVEEIPRCKDVLLNAHLYMVKLSQVEDREIFKICIEYWIRLVAELYEEVQNAPVGDEGLMRTLSLQGTSGMLQGVPMRKDFYVDVLANLRLVIIERMVKPEEVIIVPDEDGGVVREVLKDSDTLSLYKSMRELLVYLTHLDVIDTESIMIEKLSKQVDGSEWSWSSLNSLCWAIGSISGTMNEENERRFVITAIKDLLGLCELKEGTDNKAVVASNIMYIVGQYPRFLKAHWAFFKIVINKIFEFMHAKHEGVQEMACDTFLKIAIKCPRQFTMLHTGESQPLIDNVLSSLDILTSNLPKQQVYIFYEGLGHIIAAQQDSPIQIRLIDRLMQTPNRSWDTLMTQAGSNVDILGNLDNLRTISNVLKTNVATCTSLKTAYLHQLGQIYLDMLGLYRAVSGIINETLVGTAATKTMQVRALRTVKKDIIRIVETFVKHSKDLDSVNNTLTPPLLEAMLGDYANNLPEAREPEVLGLMTALVNTLQSRFNPHVPIIMDTVFEPTLSMINKDFTEYPDHRVAFYKLLRTIDKHCFDEMVTLSAAQFRLFMDSIIWAIKHTTREVSDLGLTLCTELVENVAVAPAKISGDFYQRYYLNILQDVFWVITDTDHKSGFQLQSQLLAYLINLVGSGQVNVLLFDPATVSTSIGTNMDFLQECCASLLHRAFPHQPLHTIQAFITRLFQCSNELSKFRLTLRDFLIQLKEFSGDNSELYLGEREMEAQRRARIAHEAAARVPGMLKPSDMG
ncbi:hypothetical protein M422DRAFT_208431 [Sphaerobolus stellatus SS14]|uniref:Importin N-terminal domain-containing protein n=1 Tax=Sphaerobolus stellatus (strain SS14) TaxID=990650 RepID=A0A0C9VYP2_SPHS4|nr:hypothetical protein M422DRAFT_208431 [Sphaerobolus stellatus SS14]